MPIKYVPFIPEPVEGQAVLGNFNRILRYKGADDVSMTLQRGMPLYEMEKQETVGENSDGNMVIRGECVSACAYLKEQGIQVDLVYIDPPFASGADYAKKVYIRRNPKVAEVIAQAEQELDVDELKAFEEKMYGDVWDKEKYLNWMYENLMAIKSVMSENASIYVHIDWHIGHYVKILLDEVFGEDNFRNEITWVRTASHNDSKQNYSRVKDSIFFYSRSEEYPFNIQYTPYTEEYIADEWTKAPSGRYYKFENMLDPQNKMAAYDFHGTVARWRTTPEKFEELWNAPQTEVPNSHGRVRLGKNGKPIKRCRIVFMDELPGVPLNDKYVSCVVCTSTLAQGVNIPIKYLLVTSIRNGLKLVKARDFQNLMGRTARAGIYTEGSIIITDCKIYDNRTNWKNGGRYLWNDCVKLFDTKLTEPCGSSILSLVQDFNIDYDVTVSGEKFIDIVIDHLDERDFLLDYAKKLEKAYLKVNPKRTQNLIVQEILLRQDIISNIENYLCLVRSAETLVNDSKKSAVDICTNTLAYAMATEKEKELLIKVFQKIEENIQQYSVEKLSRYSNAMSGIGLSSLIEEWIVQNELTEKIYTETELLYVITELYLQICGDFRYQEHIQSICKKWIDGQTPMEINNKETIGIAEVESLCNKRISYEMNFLIGNICDLIEVDGENEEQVDQRNILTLLQKKVKYGVPNMTAISICESVFNDRLLAIELAQILSDANIGTDKILNMLKAHSEEIFSCLDSYPEYFKDRLSVLMK